MVRGVNVAEVVGGTSSLCGWWGELGRDSRLGRKRQWGSSSVSGWLISLAEIANWVNRANLEGRSVSG